MPVRERLYHIAGLGTAQVRCEQTSCEDGVREYRGSDLAGTLMRVGPRDAERTL